MKWTLVTGAARGFGAELCLALAQKGYPVLVHYNKSQMQAEKLVQACHGYGVDAEMIQGDFSSTATTLKFIECCQSKYPQVKNLINNVGNYLIKSASETTIDEWEGLFQTNVHAPFALSRAFLPSISKCQGSIINMGVVGLHGVRADIHHSAYSATKMALLMLTKALAKETSCFNMRVNMVSPGYMENAVDLPKELHKLPMQRAASLAEVVRVLLFLLSEESAYITGQNIEVGGGLNL